VPDVVCEPGSFTAPWIEAALQSALPGASVAAVVSVDPIGTGQMASCYRITLEGAGGAPQRLIAKVPSPGTSAVAEGGYRNEVRFYQHVAPHATGRIARCYYAAMEPSGPRFVLLLEDLAPAVQGDQIAGCSTDDVHGALVNLADLHGSLWEHASLACFDQLVMDDATATDSFDAFMRWGTDEFVARYADRLADDDVHVLRAFCARSRGYRTNRVSPRSIVHGDYRLDNLLYRRDPLECIVVDWQTAMFGPPANDVAFCISTGLSIDDRRATEQQLVHAYGARLRTHGVARSDAELWHDYRFSLGHGVIITVLGAVTAVRTPRGDDMFMVMTSRVCTAIRDHDALASYD
jgi:hypothetical protein